MKNRIRNILLFVFSLWAAGVILVYFSRIPCPFTHLIKLLSGFSLIIIASLGIGEKTISRLNIKTVTFIENLSVSAGIGLGVIQVIVLIMGGLKLYKPAYAYIVLMLIVILSKNNLIIWVKMVIEKWRRHSQNRFSFMGAVFLIILVLSLGISYLNSISPLVNDYGLSENLSYAKMYVQRTGLYNIPFNYTSNLPIGMTMLQVLGLLVCGTSAARLISYCFLVLLAIGVYSMTRRFFHRKIALFATTITVSTPFIFKLYLIDHPFISSVFYSFMALYCFICWYSQIEEKKGGWLIISGIFTAFSLSMGFYAMFTPLVLLIMIFYMLLNTLKNTGIHEVAAKTVYFIFPFILFLIPVFTRNFLSAGNPFFPFFADVNLNIDTTKSFWGYLFPLWYIPFENEINMKNFFYLGTVYFVFLPGLFLIKVGKTIRIIIAYFCIYFLIYIFMGRNLIFLYSVIPAVSIITAYIIVNLYGQRKYYYQFVMGIFLLTIGINFYTIWPWINLQDKVDIALGYISRRQYLTEHMNGFAVMDYINNNTPRDSKIFLIGERRSFYIDREIISHDTLSKDPFSELVKTTESAEELKEELKKLGVTHLFVNRNKALSDPALPWRGWVKLKFHEGNYYFYEL